MANMKISVIGTGNVGKGSTRILEKKNIDFPEKK